MKVDFNSKKYNLSSVYNGQTIAPSFKATLPKNAEKQISDEALKIASAAIAATAVIYIGGKTTLTQEQQEKIINRYISGESSETIARDYNVSDSTVRSLINKQKKKNEIKLLRRANLQFFKPEQQADVIQRYKDGEAIESIAKSYNCSLVPIQNLIKKLPNFMEIQKEREKNKTFFSEDNKNYIISNYIKGASIELIAQELECSTGPIYRFLQSCEDYPSMQNQHQQNKQKIKSDDLLKIIERFKNGESAAFIANDYDCASVTIINYLKQQPNYDEIKELNKKNRASFTSEQIEEIIERYKSGESFQTIGVDLNKSPTDVQSLIYSLPNVDEIKELNIANRKIAKSIKLSEEQKLGIIEKYRKGKGYLALAREYGCTYSIIMTLIKQQDNSEELRQEHKQNIKKYTKDEEIKIIEEYKSGKSFLFLARKYSCSYSAIRNLIIKQKDKDDIIKSNRINSKILSPVEIKEVIEKYKKGESSKTLASSFGCSTKTIQTIISIQKDAEDIKITHKQNNSYFTEELIENVIRKYRMGESFNKIASDLECSSSSLCILINNLPNAQEIKIEHNQNTMFFNNEQINDILIRKTKGESSASIAKDYNCTFSLISKIYYKELNKNKEGTTKESFWHKYEEYSIDELKTRISECISIKQVEENDELLEIMFFLDEKAKFGEDEKALSIDFIRLLDKLEQQKASTKNVIESQTVKDLFDLMDKDLIKQQIFEELNKDFNTVIDDLNSCGNEALGDICSKYIAHNIDDEDNIASMKTILNIISSNDEKAIRHKLVAFDNMKQNPNDERIKEAEEIYGEDNQEKIGQYIIFDQVLKGEYTNTDFDNDVLKFVDELKDMHLNKDAIIKRLIELEDYFNSKEAQNNSLTNFIKHFNLNDNYINKLLTDFYIDNIYKDKITTIEVTADSKYFSGENITLMIYPEAKQATLSNTEVNFDKHLFLIGSEEYAKYFASRKLGSLGVKIFTLDKSYQKEGFYSGENVLEIKVPNGYNGARLAAKIKKEDDRVFEIKYFMPNGFHREKKRTDL